MKEGGEGGGGGQIDPPPRKTAVKKPSLVRFTLGRTKF